MVQVSIFDLLQSTDTPQAKDLQRWLKDMFPQATGHTSIQMAIQLEKLFEMAIFENHIDTVHLLLQQGFSPNIRGDWGTTPLMWADCLRHAEIATLLKAYGANQRAKSFSGKVAKEFHDNNNKELPEYQAILQRQAEIHAQVAAGYLKPLGTFDPSTSTINTKTVQRQIDNGKGVDELFKKLCDKNPQKRIKAEEALKHPFLTTGINFSNLLKQFENCSIKFRLIFFPNVFKQYIFN